MKTGIVIASRADSARVPGKAFRILNGVPLIEHLVRRCMKSDLPVCVAVPSADAPKYAYLKHIYPGLELFDGFDNDPLARLASVASRYGLDQVIRVCHDKIFIEPHLIQMAAEAVERKNLDYLYSSHFTAGSAFEVISAQSLRLASSKYANIEHISYAIKNVTQNTHNLEIPESYRSEFRFLVDYPEDLTLLELILASCGNDCTLSQAIGFMRSHSWAAKLNQHPVLSVYTCALNAERYIEKCMGSVAEQQGFKRMEYILVDDFSTDETPLLMAKMASTFPNVRFIRNPFNKGLASSSNVALSEARGKYIIRLDADDYLVGKNVLQQLLSEIEETGKDAIYPNNYFGSLTKVQNGKEQHHVGGAIFRRSAVNHVKFTERLRGYEGLDFFLRARNQVSIGYFGKPTFFYRQRKDSMSKTNLADRARIRADIEANHAR